MEQLVRKYNHTHLIITPFSWIKIMQLTDVLEWGRWVNKNIVFNLEHDSAQTTGVKLRIATGMLNKLKSLSEEDKKIIHENLTTNVYNEMFKIAASQLPF